jgi:HEPN domain-containing protein
MSQGEAIKAWVDSAADDWDTALTLLKNKKYSHALFFVQLSLEKLIKALHVKRQDDSPLFVHNLVLLAQKAELELSEYELTDLKEISGFNVSARYDTYKREFYHKATAEYAQTWFGKAESLRAKFNSWL